MDSAVIGFTFGVIITHLMYVIVGCFDRASKPKEPPAPKRVPMSMVEYKALDHNARIGFDPALGLRPFQRTARRAVEEDLRDQANR